MRLWERFLTLSVGEGEAADPAGAGGGGELSDASLDDLIDLADSGSESPPAGDSEPESPALKAERNRVRQLEQDLENERRARRESDSRAFTPAPQPAADPDFAREEQELTQARANGATADQLYWLKFKIDLERQGRQTRRESSEARIEARDSADRVEFGRLELTKPGIYKRYSDRVEKAVAESRAKGAPLPRMAVLRLLIGDDMMNGTIKPKSKPKTEPQTEQKRVDRGTPPRGRSDVTSKGGTTEREKRRERLQNQYI